MARKLDWEKINREKRAFSDREIPSRVAGNQEMKTFHGHEKPKSPSMDKPS